MQTTASSTGPTERRRISTLSSAGLNPYLDLLYGALESAGMPRGPQARLTVPWLLAHRRDVRYLHIHWPEPLYRLLRGPSSLRPYLSWAKLALFEARLRLARALGYDVVWTIHQVYPHDGAARLDYVAAKSLARHAGLLLAHDAETAARAESELGIPEDRVAVVAHGSYVGVYPPGRRRTDMLRSLGLDENRVVFLCFGELRANSDIEVLLEAFADLQSSDTALVIAGHAKDRRTGAAVAAAAAADDRIVRVGGFVPFQSVRELYDAADVAVVPRSDGGTSGSLILALSLGTPVIAADMPAYRRLLADGDAGWLFRPGSAAGLRSALEAAATDERDRIERGAAAASVATALDWHEAAVRLASLLRA